jgi:SulP family sulfate permease
LPPGVGLVTGAIAGLLGAFLGGSRLQVTGPEVALAPISLEIVLRYGIDGLIVATFLAGLIQIGFGVLRIGRLIHAIPVPVVGGFMAAVGLLVFDAQLPRLLGLPSDLRLLTDIRDPAMLASIDFGALAVGIIVIAIFVMLPRLTRAVPAPLVAVGVAVLAMQLFGLSLATVAPIDAAMPTASLPAFGRVVLADIWPEALALAMLASIDSLLCAVSVDARTRGERTRTDQELVAQGVANMASACFGGMPVAAAVVRSIAAVEAGATTRLAPIAQSVFLGVVLLVLAPFVSYLPIVALAGILLVVGVRLIDVRALVAMWRIARFEAVVFIVTALGILLTDFVLGVGIGVVAALVHFARQQRSAAQTFERARGLRFEGALFFGSMSDIEGAIRDAIVDEHVVIDVSAVTSVDVTGAMALVKALRGVAKDGVAITIQSGGRRLDPALRFFLDECRADGLEIAEHHDRTSRPVFSSRPPAPQGGSAMHVANL